MIDIEHSIMVNQDLSLGDPELSVAEVWQGLVMKAEAAVPFVPAISRCEVISREPDGFIREVDLRGETLRERIRLEPMQRVTFDRLDGRAMGTITNEIVEMYDGNISLRFRFRLTVEDLAPGGPEEEAYQENITKQYRLALENTLAKVRELKKRGTLGRVTLP